MKNRNEMSTREYLEYIPTEVENGFLKQEDLIREYVYRYIPIDPDKMYTSLSECAGYLLDIIADNPGKDLYLNEFNRMGNCSPEIYYKEKENDNEYVKRLFTLASLREESKNHQLKLIKEKEYQKELAKLNKKYGKS